MLEKIFPDLLIASVTAIDLAEVGVQACSVGGSWLKLGQRGARTFNIHVITTTL